MTTGRSRASRATSLRVGRVLSRNINTTARLQKGYWKMSLKGREGLLRKMEAIKGLPRVRMRKAVEVGAKNVTAMQKRIAVKSSGDLERSIGYTFGDYKAENSNVRGVASKSSGDPDLSATIHAGDAKAFYAGWIESGISKPWKIGGKFAGSTHPGFKAQPFFYPSFRALKRQNIARIMRAGRKAIKDGAKA